MFTGHELFTGHDRMASYSDTTSATGSLLLYHLATNQDKQAILHTEIRQDKSTRTTGLCTGPLGWEGSWILRDKKGTKWMQMSWLNS